MSFCENCINYDMCNYEYEHCDTDTVLTFFPNNTDCPWFKNKVNFVEAKWIDVNDRLPKEDVRVLVAITDKNYKHVKKYVPKLDTDRRFDGKWVRWGEHITHWMPLPDEPIGF